VPYSIDLQLPDADAEAQRALIALFHRQLSIAEKRGPVCCYDPEGHRRWCFDDLAHARSFQGVFGGTFVERPGG